jgi:hypothetical protein
MKLKRLFLSSAILFLTFTYMAFGQKIVTITLMVDTNNPSESYFLGQSPGDDPSEFLTTLDIGDYIIWNGQPINGVEEIHIVRIKRESGPNVFNVQSIRNIGAAPGRSAERNVRAIIRNSTKIGKVPEDYKYSLTYTIGEPDNPGPNPGNGIIIDPLIRTNQ